MQLKIPGSKSISNRALLLAALAQGTSVLHNLQISADILAMIDALRALGVSIELNQQSQTARILGCNGNFPHRAAQINCYESGTLARFMLVLCSGVAGIYHLDGASSLRKRPLSTQLKTLEQMGVNYSSDRLPLTIESTEVLAGGEIYADGSQTSQHISALLMMAPFMKQSLILKAENSVSRPYIEMTCKMMQEFGVEVVSDPEGWCVFLPQYYQSREYEIESDWSTAAYLLSAAALTSSKLTISNISTRHSNQGDAVVVSILEKMGCEIIEANNAITLVGPKQLRGISIDMRDSPDIFMAIAAIALLADSPTTITGITHARYKESDRIATMAQGLKQLGAIIEEGQGAIRIYPSKLHGGVIDTQSDHRIAMAFAILGLKVKDIQLNDKECVTKSCPEFFNLLEQVCR